MKFLRFNLFLFFIFSSIFSQNKEKILFVGNSFTFYWNLPSIVESMAAEKEIFLDIHQSTAGGASLKQHWFGDKNLNTKKLIESGDYSTIILQDYSSNPLLKIKESNEYFNRFIQLAKSNQGQPIIYGTWMFPSISSKKYKSFDTKKMIGTELLAYSIRDRIKIRQVPLRVNKRKGESRYGGIFSSFSRIARVMFIFFCITLKKKDI